MYVPESDIPLGIYDKILTYYRVIGNDLTSVFNSKKSFKEFSINSLSKILQ